MGKQRMGNMQKRLVIKIGSSTLVDESCQIRQAWLDALALQVSNLKEAGWQVIIVSSGAIACGLHALNFSERPHDTPSQQAAASVGQCAFSAAWKSAFAAHNITTGNILLTRRDTADRTSYLHARDTLCKLLELGVVPIINENDTVSVEQIKFGDNDTLAALVSCLIDANVCVILSDIEGLFDKNPQLCADAKLIERVDRITPEIMAVATTSGSSIGSGGMITKLNAARVLTAAGIYMVVAHGNRVLENDEFIESCTKENPTNCTIFTPHKVAHAITPKKLWIALGSGSQGSIIVDAGAQKALQDKGSSLLAVGVVRVSGAFEAESIVDVTNEDGNVIARGRVQFSADEISLACGRTSAQLSSNKLLAPLSQRPVIHRDELMVF